MDRGQGCIMLIFCAIIRIINQVNKTYYFDNSMKSIKQKKVKTNLYDQLRELTDYRRAQGRMHELRFILIIVIMAIMSDFKSLRAMGDFVKKNKDELIKLFKPNKDRLPSYLTIGRALQHIDFDELNKIFNNWAIGYVTIEDKDWISADGKAIAGTVTNSQNKFQKFTGLVSLFSNKRKQVIGASRTNSKKENEIPQLKSLIKMLELEGVVITGDALHCQANTIKEIVKSKNDYCIGVKGNQPRLLSQVKKKYSRRKSD